MFCSGNVPEFGSFGSRQVPAFFKEKVIGDVEGSVEGPAGVPGWFKSDLFMKLDADVRVSFLLRHPGLVVHNL